MTFTRGPLALAEDVESDAESDVHINLPDEAEAIAQWLEPVSAEVGLAYRIPGEDSVLIRTTWRARRERRPHAVSGGLRTPSLEPGSKSYPSLLSLTAFRATGLQPVVPWL